MNAIFEKPEELYKKSTKTLSSWGEKLVALDFFNQFGDRIEYIERQKTPDWKIVFKDKTEIGVEVKSSSFKDDYVDDHWFFGIPLKKKDLEPNVDLIAMVNSFHFYRKLNKNENRIREIYGGHIQDNLNTSSINSDGKKEHETESLILYFNKLDIKPINLFPFLKIPIAFLVEILSKNNNMNFKREYFSKIRNFKDAKLLIFNKAIILNGNLVINTKYNTHYNDIIGEYPDWFGKKEECLLIQKYHNSIRLFVDRISNNMQKFLGSNLEAIINNLENMKLDQLNYTQKYNNCEENCVNFNKCKLLIKQLNLNLL